MKSSKSCIGFTLIELLVTTGIVSILASINMANFSEDREKVYATEAILMLRDMDQASQLVANSCSFATDDWAQTGYQHYKASTGTIPTGTPGKNTCTDNILDFLPHLEDSAKFGNWTSMVTLNQVAMWSGGAKFGISNTLTHCGIRSGAPNSWSHYQETYVDPKPDINFTINNYWDSPHCADY